MENGFRGQQKLEMSKLTIATTFFFNQTCLVGANASQMVSSRQAWRSRKPMKTRVMCSNYSRKLDSFHEFQ